MTHYANDTICALATPVGGAIAVVRVSGSQSYPVLGRLLRQDLSACAPATLRHASTVPRARRSTTSSSPSTVRPTPTRERTR